MLAYGSPRSAVASDAVSYAVSLAGDAVVVVSLDDDVVSLADDVVAVVVSCCCMHQSLFLKIININKSKIITTSFSLLKSQKPHILQSKKSTSFS